MTDKSDSKPLMPTGCWAVPLLLVAGGGLLYLLGNNFWPALAIGATVILFADLVWSARRTNASIPERFAARSREYVTLAAIASIAASIFLLK